MNKGGRIRARRRCLRGAGLPAPRARAIFRSSLHGWQPMHFDVRAAITRAAALQEAQYLGRASPQRRTSRPVVARRSRSSPRCRARTREPGSGSSVHCDKVGHSFSVPLPDRPPLVTTTGRFGLQREPRGSRARAARSAVAVDCPCRIVEQAPNVALRECCCWSSQMCNQLRLALADERHNIIWKERPRTRRDFQGKCPSGHRRSPKLREAPNPAISRQTCRGSRRRGLTWSGPSGRRR